MNKLLIIISLLLTSTTSYAREGYGGKAYLVLIIGVGIILYTILEHFYYKTKFKLKSKNLKTKNVIKHAPQINLFIKHRKTILVGSLITSIVILFIFTPYKTTYYRCYDRSLTVNKYLFNSYSMVFSRENLIPGVVRKEFCKANKGSVGFVCKFQVPKNIVDVKSAREKAFIMGHMDDVKELDDYINSIPSVKYLYRFDPVTAFLRESITNEDEEPIEHLYRCKQTENKL